VTEAQGDGSCTVDTAVGRIRAQATGDVAVGLKAEVAVRPERLVLHQGEVAADRVNHAAGVLLNATYLGEAIDYQIELAGGVQVVASCHPSVEIALQARVTVEFPEGGCSIVPAE
jgi:hypothetical protein